MDINYTLVAIAALSALNVFTIRLFRTEGVSLIMKALEASTKQLEVRSHDLLMERLASIESIFPTLFASFFEKKLELKYKDFISIFDIYLIIAKKKDSFFSVGMSGDDIMVAIEEEGENKYYSVDDFLYNVFYRALLKEILNEEVGVFKGSREDFLVEIEKILNVSEFKSLYGPKDKSH